jgi:hypothetical protein
MTGFFYWQYWDFIGYALLGFLYACTALGFVYGYMVLAFSMASTGISLLVYRIFYWQYFTVSMYLYTRIGMYICVYSTGLSLLVVLGFLYGYKVLGFLYGQFWTFSMGSIGLSLWVYSTGLSLWVYNIELCLWMYSTGLSLFVYSAGLSLLAILGFL